MSRLKRPPGVHYNNYSLSIDQKQNVIQESVSFQYNNFAGLIIKQIYFHAIYRTDMRKLLKHKNVNEASFILVGH